MITKVDCLYADRIPSGFECGLDRKGCMRQEWQTGKGYYDNGECIYYNQSTPCNEDGTIKGHVRTDEPDGRAINLGGPKGDGINKEEE